MNQLLFSIADVDLKLWLSRLYLIDRQLSVISYKLDVTFIQYQSAITRRDFDTAATLFDQIPASLHNKVAKFLEAQVRSLCYTSARGGARSSSAWF